MLNRPRFYHTITTHTDTILKMVGVVTLRPFILSGFNPFNVRILRFRKLLVPYLNIISAIVCCKSNLRFVD